MFKRIFVLIVVLFAVISCKQNTSSLITAPPTVDDGTTDNNIDSGNSNGGNTNNTDSGSNSGYGVYKVFILGDNGEPEEMNFNILDTDSIVRTYYNMIIDSTTQKAKFELHKLNKSETAEGETYYTFNTNLNIMKTEEKKEEDGSTTIIKTISKKFRGVCLVRIYPDAAEKPAHSPLLGDYTLAGVYTEVTPPPDTLISFMAMTNSDKFQSYGYDELIILRPDITNINFSAYADNQDAAEDNYTNYRADILFDINKTINLYYYNPDRAFENQNTNYIFKRVTETAAK